MDDILEAFFALFHRKIAVVQFDHHFIPLGEHLADLQEGFVLGLRHHQPDIEQSGQAGEGKEDEAVGAQAAL